MGAAIPENSPQTATAFGKYLLIKRLAMGGMAELFLAQKPPNPELLVVKRILPYLTEEPEFVQMFLDEARIAAQLHHPNVVQVFELGSINQSIFIAMEYVEGVDLRRILAEESRFSASVPYAVAARICAQVAAGLDHAHNSKGMDGRPLGLIHRDVSPQNVMVAYNGQVKLVDFGIAKAEAFAERSKPGVIKGKFLYLSPEQVMQERLDHRSDIFALGVMLYEVTTGRSPFSRPNTEGILFAIRSESPSPPHLLRDGYPLELSRIVMKCLLKDRTQRYQRAAHVQEDLDAFLSSGAVKQSQDVAAYVARLLGAEEERTQIHVPISGARKDLPAVSPPPPPPPPPSSPAHPPPGLVARPSLRVGAHALPPAVDAEGDEPSTEMARPADLLAARVALGDDEVEATAVGTLPGRAGPRAMARIDDESTTQERLGRGSPGGRRPALVTRKPLPSAAVVDRRRGPPVRDDDEDYPEDDGGPSEEESLSVSTLNERGPGRFMAGAHGENTSDTPADFSETHSLVRPSSDDGDEPSSTSVDEWRSTGVLPASSAGRGRRVLRALALLVLLAGVCAGLAWGFLSMTAPPPEAVGEAPPPAEAPVDPSPGLETGTGTGSNPEGSAASPETDLPTPTSPPAGSLSGHGREGGSLPDEPVRPAVPPSSPSEEKVPPRSASGVKVRVQFKAPVRSMMWVGETAVKPNGFLSVDPGPLQIRYRCPGTKGPPLMRDFQVPSTPWELVVFKLDCRARAQR
ncbi:MAG: protein kinase [Cystobacter sp.]